MRLIGSDTIIKKWRGQEAATLLMATPTLTLAYLVALIDGLVQRAVRRG